MRREGLRFMGKLFNQAGLTSVHEARLHSAEDLGTYQEGKEKGELTLRVYALVHDGHFPALRDSGIRTGFGDEWFRIGGIKLFADGSIGSRNAYVSEPYVGTKDDHGMLQMTPEETEAKVIAIHQAGFQVCTHANGDLAIDMVLTAYEKAQAAYPRQNPRHRIEHGTIVTPDLLKRMKALGCVVTPLCTYVYYHGEKWQFYGEQRLRWMFAQRSFLDHGIVSTGSSDYQAGPFEPLVGIQSCVTRMDSSGRVWGPNQRISVEEALKIYTLHGAYASFEERLKGSIEIGKLADLVVLGADPTQVEPQSI
jgi:predicted amidohydrolase YtcJ